MTIRFHTEPATGKILGYYPTEIAYPNLPPIEELQEITDEQHQAALAINANAWKDGAPVVDEGLFPPAPEPPAPLTAAEKLAAAGLTIDELKGLLGLITTPQEQP